MSEFTIIVHNRCRYLVHGFLVLSSGVPNATQGSVISKTVWIAKTTATIAAPNIAGAVETMETIETISAELADGLRERFTLKKITGVTSRGQGGAAPAQVILVMSLGEGGEARVMPHSNQQCC